MKGAKRFVQNRDILSARSRTLFSSTLKNRRVRLHIVRHATTSALQRATAIDSCWLIKKIRAKTRSRTNYNHVIPQQP